MYSQIKCVHLSEEQEIQNCKLLTDNGGGNGHSDEVGSSTSF